MIHCLQVGKLIVGLAQSEARGQSQQPRTRLDQEMLDIDIFIVADFLLNRSIGYAECQETPLDLLTLLQIKVIQKRDLGNHCCT